MRRLKRTDNGFSVVEVLVALAILVLMGTELFNATSGAARNSARANERQSAARWAEARLASLGVSEIIVPGVTTGLSTEGFRWEQRIDASRSARIGNTPTGVWVTLTLWPPGTAASPSDNPALSLRVFKLIASVP